jgi:anti-anti-sigma regulatory factor
MASQQTQPAPVVVTLPSQINAANAERAAEQISAAFTPGTPVVIADLAGTVCRDRSVIRHLLRAHRQAAARGRRVRFVIRPGQPLQRITDFADIHPLLAVYPTLQHAITGRSPTPPRQRLAHHRSPRHQGPPASGIPRTDDSMPHARERPGPSQPEAGAAMQLTAPEAVGDVWSVISGN